MPSKNSAMASLIARSYECRRQDTVDALQVIKSVILKMPSDNPERQALSIMHSRLNENRFLSKVFGVARDQAEILRGLEHNKKKEADRKQSMAARPVDGNQSEASQFRLLRAALQGTEMARNLVAGDATSSLLLPAHVIGSARQSTNINEGRPRTDAGSAGRMTAVEVAAMLAEFPPSSSAHQEIGSMSMEKSDSAPMTVEQMEAKMKSIMECPSGAIFSEKEEDVADTAKEMMKTMAPQKDENLQKVEMGQVTLGVVEDHIKNNLSENVLQTVGAVTSKLEIMKLIASKVHECHSGFVTAIEAQDMVENPQEMIDKIGLEQEKEEEAKKLIDSGDLGKTRVENTISRVVESWRRLKSSNSEYPESHRGWYPKPSATTAVHKVRAAAAGYNDEQSFSRRLLERMRKIKWPIGFRRVGNVQSAPGPDDDSKGYLGPNPRDCGSCWRKSAKSDRCTIHEFGRSRSGSGISESRTESYGETHGLFQASCTWVPGRCSNIVEHGQEREAHAISDSRKSFGQSMSLLGGSATCGGAFQCIGAAASTIQARIVDQCGEDEGNGEAKSGKQQECLFGDANDRPTERDVKCRRSGRIFQTGVSENKCGEYKRRQDQTNQKRSGFATEKRRGSDRAQSQYGHAESAGSVRDGSLEKREWQQTEEKDRTDRKRTGASGQAWSRGYHVLKEEEMSCMGDFISKLIHSCQTDNEWPGKRGRGSASLLYSTSSPAVGRKTDFWARLPSNRLHFSKWPHAVSQLPDPDKPIDYRCGKLCMACDRFGKRSVLDFMAGGAPCFLLSLFGGKLNECSRCHNSCGSCVFRQNQSFHGGCSSTWCSSECFEAWMMTLPPPSAAYFEILLHPSSTRDYVFRGAVKAMITENLMSDAVEKVKGRSAPSPWIGGFQPLNDLSIISKLGIKGKWVEELIENSAQEYHHEVIGTCIFLNGLSEDLRNEVLRVTKGYSISSWGNLLKFPLDLARRYRIFGHLRGNEVRALKGLKDVVARRNDPASWLEDRVVREQPRIPKIDPTNGMVSTRYEDLVEQLQDRIPQLMRGFCTDDVKSETPCSVEAEILLDVANGSTSSRGNFEVVTDSRKTRDTRPGKYATLPTAPSGIVFAVLVLFPMILLSMVTKPEPGLKQRVLAAVRDLGYIRAAIACRGMERRIRDPAKRLLFKQGPEDAATMLFTVLNELLSGSKGKGVLAEDGVFGDSTENLLIDGISTDFAKYNENEEHAEIINILVEMGLFFCREKAPLRAGVWTAISYAWLMICPESGEHSYKGLNIMWRWFNSLPSGDRMTMLMNNINHDCYEMMRQLYATKLGLAFAMVVVYLKLVGDDEAKLARLKATYHWVCQLQKVEGHELNSSKQLMGRCLEFLQRLIVWDEGLAGARLHRARGRLISTLVTGNYYQPKNTSPMGAMQATCEVGVDLVSRGEDPQTLLFAIGQCFDVEKALYARRVTHTLPKALVMGKGGDGGEYSTSALKNYPPGLCRALSGILEQWMGMYVQQHFVPTMDESGFTSFLQFVQNLQIHFNFSAMRGADFAQ